MTGVQTLLPVMLNHVNQGRLTLERLADLTSAGPARVLGIESKGRIALGYDADLTLVDLKARRTITNSQIASLSGWTPYHGVTVVGWPTATIIRGHLVMQEDQLLSIPQGQPLKFLET
jgi:dihydroorotase